MKVVFLLDNNEYVEVAPERLQIRQVAPGQSALGVEVTVPVRNEEGVAQTNEDGSPKTQTGFRPFINYAVNLSVPEAAAQKVPEAPAQSAPVAKGKDKKAKSAKRR